MASDIDEDEMNGQYDGAHVPSSTAVSEGWITSMGTWSHQIGHWTSYVRH